MPNSILDQTTQVAQSANIEFWIFYLIKLSLMSHICEISGPQPSQRILGMTLSWYSFESKFYEESK